MDRPNSESNANMEWSGVDTNQRSAQQPTIWRADLCWEGSQFQDGHGPVTPPSISFNAFNKQSDNMKSSDPVNLSTSAEIFRYSFSSLRSKHETRKG